MAREQFLGIDFGTSTTLIAESLPAARPTVVPIGHAESWMPSAAAVSAGALVVGEDALTHNPAALISSVKRCITGRAAVARSADGSVERAADEVIGAVLRELANRARADRLPISEKGVTRLGCPAMWDADQRERLLGLAESAGFSVGPSTLIDEPIAAGLNWIGRRTQLGEYFDEERVLVFDMGGGTLDVAILDVTTGPLRDPEIYVLASDGVDEAGDVLDNAIVADLENALEDQGIAFEALPDPDLARAYLMRSAVEAKVDLSSHQETEVYVGYQGMKLPSLHYNREQLEDAMRPQLERAWSLILSTLRASYLAREGGAITSALRQTQEDILTSKIHHVLLAGGMSRVPAVEKFLSKKLPSARIHTFPGSNGPQEAIVAGLAENTSYAQVNLHRPAFDFVLEFAKGNGDLARVPIYRAHTRLYAWWEALSRDRLTYEWPNGATAVNRDSARFLPVTGYGQLAVYAMDGTPVDLRYKETDVPALKVAFGHSDVRFTLSPEGFVNITDGRGSSQSFRVTHWPVLTGGFARLALPVTEPQWQPMERRWWDVK
ncbi:Hsp70 family protein [Paenarthrobacter aromaticivorans]|uniref:Hsp70 family protein n=1 Tax=Paenarthrobacter aromaticivorans TaxID=2849150 RepID=UPI003A7FB1B8